MTIRTITLMIIHTVPALILTMSLMDPQPIPTPVPGLTPSLMARNLTMTVGDVK